MKLNVFLVVILAPVLLVAACGGNSGGANDAANQAAGICGREYVHHLATQVARRDFEESPATPFSPSDESCKTLVYSHWATPSATPPPAMLLEDLGTYTFADLGYPEDIVFHAWEPGIIALLPGNPPTRYANSFVEYDLPDDAAQGPDKWYRFHLHLEVEFADALDGGAAMIDVTRNRSNVARTSFVLDAQGDTLHIDAGGRGFQDAKQRGNLIEANLISYFSNAAVGPGHNKLAFKVFEEDGAVVQTLRIFPDSAIEITTLSYDDAQATAFPPPDYSSVTPPCDREDPQCLIEHFDGREADRICEIFGVLDSDCIDLMNAALDAVRPTPLPVLPIYEELLFQDEAIREIVGEGVRDQDYWLQIGPSRDPGHGDANGEVASATLVLAEPVSWSGKKLQANDPCAPYSSEGYTRPGHFCFDIELEFTSRLVILDEVRVVNARIFTRRGFVANLRKSPFPAYYIEQFSQQD